MVVRSYNILITTGKLQHRLIIIWKISVIQKLKLKTTIHISFFTENIWKFIYKQDLSCKNFTQLFLEKGSLYPFLKPSSRCQLKTKYLILKKFKNMYNKLILINAPYWFLSLWAIIKKKKLSMTSKKIKLKNKLKRI